MAILRLAWAKGLAEQATNQRRCVARVTTSCGHTRARFKVEPPKGGGGFQGDGRNGEAESWSTTTNKICDDGDADDREKDVESSADAGHKCKLA